MSRAYAALVITMVFWASAFVAIRHLGESFHPGALSLGRQLVAAIVLGLIAFARGFTKPQARDIPSIVAIGALWFAVYHVALNEAEHRIDAGTASMLLQISPILLTILAVVFLGERAHAAFVVGLLIAFAGVVIIGFSTSDSSGGGDLAGVLLCMVSSVAYAISVVLQKSVLPRLPALELTFLAATIGAVCTLPFAGQLTSDIRDASSTDVWWLLYLGVFPTAIAFTTYAFALGHLPASVAGLSTYLVPPITVVIAWIALDETPPALAYVGGVLCLVGVWWARRRPRATATPSPSGTASPQQA